MFYSRDNVSDFFQDHTSDSKSLQSCPTLCDPMDCVAHQAPLFMGFSRQEYWSGLLCPSPGDLLNPGIEPTSKGIKQIKFVVKKLSKKKCLVPDGFSG